MGLHFEAAAQLPTGKALAVLGSDAAVTAGSLGAFLRSGGKVLLLPRPPGADPWGVVSQPVLFRGATDVPAWPECRGLSRSELRLRGTVEMPPVAETAPVVAGANGLLGRATDGPGVAVMLQVTPDMLPGREKTYFRYSQWRLTRTLAQLLANLGGAFEMDGKSLSPGWNQEYLPLPLAGEWQCRVEKALPAATDPNVRTRDPGRVPETANWEAPDAGTGAWQKLKLPGYWESLPDVGEGDGAFWVRREVQLPPEWVGQELLLQLGTVDDTDLTWFNGAKVGETSGWNAPRSYRIPAEFVRAGRNVVAIRVFDEFGGGSFGAPAGDMRLGRVVPAPVAEGEEILRNRDFANGLEGWILGVFEPARANATVTEETPPQLLGQRSVKLEVTKPSETT
jgi:beta-galactosidase